MPIGNKHEHRNNRFLILFKTKIGNPPEDKEGEQPEVSEGEQVRGEEDRGEVRERKPS